MAIIVVGEEDEQVVPIMSERRCKLCSTPKRAEIDELIRLRSTKGVDKEGVRVDLAYVLRSMAEFGVVNPTEDNLKNHWRKHCQVGKSEIIAAAQNAQIEKLEQLLQGGDHHNLDEALRTIVTLGVEGMREKIAKGMNPITVDHIMKAASELTRRSHNEAQHDLLTQLVGGLGEALSSPKTKQIESGEIIDIDVEVLEEA